MRSPNYFSLHCLVEYANSNSACIGDKWVPHRPIGLANFRNRVKIAWRVFIGKYDAVEWPEGQ